MAKPEWGVKRTCLACGARFYDMQKNPAACPGCGVVHDPEAIFRPRRNRAVAEPPPAPAPAKPADPEAALAELADDADVEVEDDEDEEIVEDADDLAEDTTDVSEVSKNIAKDDPA